MACCKACAAVSGRSRRKKSISGMKTKNITGIVKTGAGVAAGLIAANMVGNLGFAQSNPIIKVLLPIAGAVAVKSFLGNSGNPIALGMAAQGINQAVKTYLPGVATTVGLSGTTFPQSTRLPGVSGSGGGRIIFD